MFLVLCSGGSARYFALSIANGFISAIIATLMVYGVTLYPLRLFEKYKRRDPQMRHTSSSSGDHSISQSKSEAWDVVIAGNIEILHRFMRFLVRSFCVENMLFIIEIMQCKQEFIKKNGDDMRDYVKTRRNNGDIEAPEMSISNSNSLSLGTS